MSLLALVELMLERVRQLQCGVNKGGAVAHGLASDKPREKYIIFI